ncbi:TPA: mechanosensitive ion channel family protein [Candidatus Micrarchaeota archaeon]|nr:mechanosensitive ion channel family protein [Candidatus Micrarchaeota archaeon]
MLCMTGALKLSLLVVLMLIVLSSSYITLFEAEDGTASKVTQTASVFLIAIVLDILVEKLLVKRIKVSKARFLISKTVSYVTYMVAIVISLAVWIEQASNLLFAIGVVGAGIAIALQKPIANLVGFLSILITGPYSPGDRIEIEGDAGDVIDIEIFHTKIMEVGQWTKYDQFTGRIKTIPNYFVLEKVVNNYSRDFGFIWEEIMIPVTYGSDWKKARKLMLDIARKHTKDEIERGNAQLRRMTYKYLLEPRAVEPALYMIPTDNWLELRLRFIVNAKHRRSCVNPIFEDILAAVSKHKSIKISSKTTARIWDAGRKRQQY